MGVAFRNSNRVWAVFPIEFEADSSQFPTAAPADRLSPFRDGGDCDADLKRPPSMAPFPARESDGVTTKGGHC